MQNLVRAVSENYNIDITNTLPYKEGITLFTPTEKFFLKKKSYSDQRVNFIHAAKEHLRNNGFTTLDRFIPTTEGLPFFIHEEGIYTLSEFIEGTEANFDIRTDVLECARLLAKMHKASKGFKSPSDSVSRDELGKLPSYFFKRLDELKRLQKKAKKNGTKFDYLFLEYLDYFYRLGEDAINRLRVSNYNKIVEQTRYEGIICHHDFTYRNVINTAYGMFLTNFDYCCLELRVYDLANFLRRKMRKCNWDLTEASLIIRDYRAIQPLSYDELEILKLILQFPQKFWRVVNKFYNSRRSWSEKSYIYKLEEVIDEIKYHKVFIDRFYSIL